MKKVLVRHIFEYWEVWDDEYATKDHIEFKHNESSSCSDNILECLNAYHWEIQKANKGYGEFCLCHTHKAEVLEIKDFES